jgi:hypothetical protein
VRAYPEGGVRAADRVVDEVAPLLFQSEDMRAAVDALVEYGARNFFDKVVFRGRRVVIQSKGRSERMVDGFSPDASVQETFGIEPEAEEKTS